MLILVGFWSAVIGAVLGALVGKLLDTILGRPLSRRGFWILVGVCAVLALLVAGLAGVQPPLPPPTMEPSTPRTSTLVPTPITVGRAVFFDDFEGDRFWTEGSDANGRSSYGQGGYNVVSQSSVSGWVWILPERKGTTDVVSHRYDNLVIEVDAVPVTDGRVTGYGVVIGWDKSNSYILFHVRPDGDCGVVRVQSHVPVDTVMQKKCPQPTRGEVARIRVEVKDGHMVAFVNKDFAGEYSFPQYQGGLLGFEAYNGGTAESQIASQVRFDNLIVWNYPDR